MKPTIIADIRYLPLRAGLKPKLCHASPPCTYFSYARIRKYGYNESGLAESFKLVAACFEAFIYLEAQTWTLENPNGILTRICKPSARTSYPAYDIVNKKTWFYSNRGDAMKRALIPMEVRQKLLKVAQIESSQQKPNGA
jgi:site-specific DNA-cytosine methylase